MTETTVTPALPEATPDQVEAAKGVNDLVMAIPMGRWLRIVRRFDMAQDDILGDFTALMIVAANEKVRADIGKDDWDRVEAMSLTEINTFLDLSDDEDDSEVEASKSDEQGPQGDAPAPGEDLPGAGDQPG